MIATNLIILPGDKNSMDPLKVLIVEDEWLIRIELKVLLTHYPDIQVVGEAGNITDAIRLFSELKPDIIFLDIQLPGGSGFDLLYKITGNYKLVFITAFDNYKVMAKDFCAIDYLMKPISKAKLSKLIEKIRELNLN